MTRIPQIPIDPDWAVEETAIDEDRLRVRETRFALGNGYIGSRGVLEEGLGGGYPGTYIAGIYDRVDDEPSEIVSLPNPVDVRLSVGSLRLSPQDMEVIEHRRQLDLKNAVLIRRTLFASEGRRYEYESVRFFCLNDPHLGAMSFSFRSLDADADVTVRQTIDGTTQNEVQAVGGPVKHYKVSAAEGRDGWAYLEATTGELGREVGMGTFLLPRRPSLEDQVGTTVSEDASITSSVRFTARKGQRYRFDTFISVWTSRELEESPRARCTSALEAAVEYGLRGLLRQHRGAWNRRWETCGVQIDGDPELQKAMRFNVYHLLIAAPREGLDVSVAAKTLAGEWYKGHVFWDNEIYVLPFFTFVQPTVARDLLRYRARRIQQARTNARSQGYEGSLWPWESADDGRDETPDTWVNFDGTKIPVYNKTREHHIAADVAYGVLSYWRATGDDQFLMRDGAEVVFETARFWASRVTRNSRTGSYEIKGVIGPNEFQESVDNNSYTNGLAGWVLREGALLFRRLSADHPYLLGSLAYGIGLGGDEVAAWSDIAEKLVLLERPDGLIEEFEAYFDRRDVRIEEWDSNGVPVWPESVELSEAADTQLVKQADVVLLLHLLGDVFTKDQKRTNYEYYLPRTTHKSSLSPPAYAMTALQLGKMDEAYDLFAMSAYTDYKDVQGNSDLGVHAASLGGAWQVVVFGYGGVSIDGDILNVDPVLSNRWRRLEFRIWFRGVLLGLRLTHEAVEIAGIMGIGQVSVQVNGQRHIVGRGRKVQVPRS